MRDNSTLTKEGIEVYENAIFRFADDFICNELQITQNNPDYQKIINKNFVYIPFK